MRYSIDGVTRSSSVASRTSLQIPDRRQQAGAVRKACYRDISATLKMLDVSPQRISDVAIRQRADPSPAPTVTPAAETSVKAEGVVNPVASPVKRRLRKDFVKKLAKRRVKYSVAVAVLSFSLYVLTDTLITNQQLKSDLTRTQVAAATAGSTSPSRNSQDIEGRDETEIPPGEVAKYSVAPDKPRLLIVDKLKIKARVRPMGTNPDGTLQSPTNIYDAGWYSRSVQPGQKGAAIIDAHASGATRLGLFARLDTLKTGDIIKIEKGDGTQLRYSVVGLTKVPLGEVDMNEMMKTHDGDEGLNLITCAGEWVQKDSTYDHRVMVFTKRVP